VKERRIQERVASTRYLTVYDRTNGKAIGGLANLSEEGAMFVTPGPIRAGTVIECRFDLPYEIMGQTEIVFDAECRWSRKNVKESRWETGFKLAVTGINRSLVSCLMLSLKLEDWGDREIRDVPTEDMANRRESVRFELDKRMEVFELRSYRKMGELADLSIQGLRLVTDHPIAKGEIVGCRVRLFKRIFQQDFIYFEARCMWNRKRKDGKCESGYRFVNIGHQDVAIILHLIIHHGEEQNTQKIVQILK
jgi:hypothetical protein